ncbi:MAG: exopolysaccharide transport family protein [Alphaproteobacteria bacterium]|nr:exopolysaccharide transport family protein [Alphaproteobacteria bacterium]
MRQAPASPDDIDLTTLGATLKRAATKLIALSLIAGTLTYLTLSTIAPQFVANAELAIVAKSGLNPFTGPDPQNSSTDLASRMDNAAVNTHVRAIQSPDLIENVAGELRLAGRPEFNPVLGPVDTFTGILRTIGLSGVQSSLSDNDRVLNEVSKRLQVYSPESSRAITINFTSIDPQLAADFANRLATSYREKLATATVAETSAVQDNLAPRIARLQDEVAKADEEVADFRNKAGLLGGGSQKTPINEQQLGDITTELTKVKTLRSTAEARAKSARDLMRRGTPEVIPEVQRSPLIQGLTSQRVAVERDILKRSTSLKPAHPIMKQLQADLAAVNRQIAGEVANLVAGLDKEAYLAAEQEQAVVASLEKMKSKVAVNTTDEVELRRLEAVATSKRGELERLRAQFEANRARTDSGAVPVEAQIINLARTPSISNFPKKLPYTLLVMVATLLLGTAFVITAGLTRSARSAGSTHAADDRLREEIAAATSIPSPRIPPSLAPLVNARHEPDLVDEPGLQPPPLHRPGHGDASLHVGDAGALARHLLDISTGATNGFRTLIATRIDAVSTAELAVATAAGLTLADKQVIIIDWSLNGTGIARQMSLPNAPGFVELLIGKATFADIVRFIPGSRTHFIPSGWAVAEGPEGLDADQLNLILDALDEAYDHIIVVGRYENARALFETIQGRFDAGIVASDTSDGQRVLDDPPDTFLGFEVADIDIIRFESRAEQAETAA